MSFEAIAARLQAGKSVTFRPKGQSMTPRIRSGQEVTILPVVTAPEVGDVVLARVKGRLLFHLISTVDGDRYQISNNHGHINGWCRRAEVYGVLGD